MLTFETSNVEMTSICVCVHADANLSTAEFEAYITIAKLEDALKPVGGLSMKRVDDNYTGIVAHFPLECLGCIGISGVCALIALSATNTRL